MSETRNDGGTGKHTRVCPACGRWVVFEDATCTIRHENPTCEGFVDIMRACGLTPKHDPWVEMVRPDGTLIEKAKA